MVHQEDIKQAVMDQIKWDSRVLSSGVKIEAKDSLIKLNGEVRNLYEKLVAEDDALSVPGVTGVENNLKVKDSEELYKVSDSQLQEAISYFLRWDNRIDATNIFIHVVSGIVTLEGFVDSYWKKLIASEQVYNITGVVKVINNLNVVPTQEILDEEIAQEIQNAFKRSILIVAEKITVSVSKGFVTLTGTVSSTKEKRKAEEIVDLISGVTGINNNLIAKN